MSFHSLLMLLHFTQDRNFQKKKIKKQTIFRLSICSTLFAYVTTEHVRNTNTTSTIDGDQLSTNCSEKTALKNRI